jgi:hypothetical protein
VYTETLTLLFKFANHMFYQIRLKLKKLPKVEGSGVASPAPTTGGSATAAAVGAAEGAAVGASVASGGSSVCCSVGSGVATVPAHGLNFFHIK